MRLWFLLIVGLIGTGILVWLGVWQVQRLAWKQNLLARIEAQPKFVGMAKSPIPNAA